MTRRAWRTYTPWIIGFVLWLTLNHLIYQAATQREMSTFRGDPLVLMAITHFILGAYIGLLFLTVLHNTDAKWRISLSRNHRYLYGSIVPLAVLGFYPVVATLFSWEIPFPFAYVPLTPLTVATGIVLMLSIFRARWYEPAAPIA